MDLILWRHAEAGDHLADPIADLERPLSPKGERQARRVADWNHFIDDAGSVHIQALLAKSRAWRDYDAAAAPLSAAIAKFAQRDA